MPEADTGDLDEWIAHLSSETRSQGAEESQPGHNELIPNDSCEDKIVYGGTVTIDADTTSSTALETGGSTRSGSPVLFAPAPIRPLQTVRSRDLWRHADEERLFIPCKSIHRTASANDGGLPIVSEGISQRGDQGTPLRLLQREKSPILRDSSASPQVIASGGKPQDTNDFLLADASSPLPLGKANSRMSASSQSSNNREEKSRMRKLRDLQRSRHHNESQKKPNENEKYLATHKDEVQMFPVPPRRNPAREYAAIGNTSLAIFESSDMNEQCQYAPFNGNTPVMEHISLSPIMLVAEQIPLQKTLRSHKSTRLVLRDNYFLHKDDTMAAWSVDSGPLNLRSDPHISRNIDNMNQDTKPKGQDLLQKDGPFILSQHNHTSQKVPSRDVAPRTMLRQTRPSEASGSSCKVRDASSQDLQSLSNPPSSIFKFEKLPSEPDLAQSFMRGSVASSCASTASKEVKLEAKVEVLQRQNKLLEAALMAVLKTGGAVNGCPCGGAIVNENALEKPGNEDREEGHERREALNVRKVPADQGKTVEGVTLESLGDNNQGTITSTAEVNPNSQHDVRCLVESAAERTSALALFMKTRKRSF